MPVGPAADIYYGCRRAHASHGIRDLWRTTLTALFPPLGIPVYFNNSFISCVAFFSCFICYCCVHAVSYYYVVHNARLGSLFWYLLPTYWIQRGHPRVRIHWVFWGGGSTFGFFIICACLCVRVRFSLSLSVHFEFGYGFPIDWS